MLYSSPLKPAKLIRRYKRFLADVEFSCGEQQTIYCPNTGAMTHCAEPGSRLWYSCSDNAKRKYRYTWEQVEDCWGGRVGIHSSFANAIVGESLRSGQLAALDCGVNTTSWLEHLESVHQEYAVATESVRFDFCLQTGAGPVMVEVKSVTLADANAVGRFPDAVTQRGLKQVQAMIHLQSQGMKSMLVYCVQNTRVETFELAQDIDPAYTTAVKRFVDGGGRILAIGCQMDESQITVDRYIPWMTS